MRLRQAKLRPYTRRSNEQGIVIMLVAVFMLFVVGAMAALSIDVVTIYTARSEAQLAADGAALAGARALANSGMTSDPNAAADGLMTSAENLAGQIAIQVAQSNPVGGRNLIAANGEVVVGFNGSATNPCATPDPVANPCITIRVRRTDLPTFFARIWGSKQVTVGAAATAEAYNPSNIAGSVATVRTRVAPTCVKPWLLPNLSPTAAGGPIFDPTNGTISDPTLLGWSFASPGGKAMILNPACSDSTGCPLPQPWTPSWNYFPGDDAISFPHPTHSLPSCAPALATNYQESIAGCIETTITCNGTANIDINPYNRNRNSDTADAVNCLTHATTTVGDADQIDLTGPSPPFQFLAGATNPLAIVNPALTGQDVMVSSSVVTVPVFDNGTSTALSTGNQIVGFVQLFLNPDSTAAPATGAVNATVINLVGCGAIATGTPILGNGASPVAVRLISAP